MERIAHLETNWSIGYNLLYYNCNLRHYNIDSAALNMLLIDLSLFHNIFVKFSFNIRGVCLRLSFMVGYYRWRF
jgi:hypothetical protein